MINPLEEAERIRKIVCKNKKRKYYRFRAGLFYGGIASADCVGCNLDCAYCWSQKPRKNPEKIGKFYSSEKVASRLIGIARKKGYQQVRITGNEPTLCKYHLLEVISLIPKDLLFILETNGILIDEKFAKDLSKFKNLQVRVSLKGSNEKMFSLITNAEPEFFEYQLKTLKNLVDNNISCSAAIMVDLYSKEEILEIREKLYLIHPSLARDLEFESLIMYPFVLENLEKRGIKIKNFVL